MVGLYLDVIFQNFYIINKIILIFFIEFKWDFFQLKLGSVTTTDNPGSNVLTRGGRS